LKQPQNAYTIYDFYNGVILDTKLAYGSNCEYAQYDTDHDGTVELITSQVPCDADWSNTAYTGKMAQRILKNNFEVGGC